MLNLDIIKAVYAKEFRELTQDTRTLLIVFLIPLLFMPAVSLTTYSTNLSQLEVEPNIAVIDSQCSTSSVAGMRQMFCADKANTSKLIADLQSAKLEAVLDIENSKVYFSNAKLSSEQTRQAIEKYHLQANSKAVTALIEEDFNSNDNIKNIVGTSLANVLVMLVIVFSFVGALNFGMDVTTGEKERGSFKLYSEFKDKISSIFAGKLLFTSLCSGVTAILGIAGIIISMLLIDTMYGDSVAVSQDDVDRIAMFFSYLQMLSISDVLVTALYLIPAIFVISSMVNLIGCFARNMKEAKLFGVLLIVVIMALTKVDLGDEGFIYTAFIPILNVFTGVNNAMTMELDLWHLCVSTLVNVAICINSLFDIKRLIVKEIV